MNGQFKPLRDSVNSGESESYSSASLTTASAFLWEWFTTKPFVDSGEVRFIGSVNSKCHHLIGTDLSPLAMLEHCCCPDGRATGGQGFLTGFAAIRPDFQLERGSRKG